MLAKAEALEATTGDIKMHKSNRDEKLTLIRPGVPEGEMEL